MPAQHRGTKTPGRKRQSGNLGARREVRQAGPIDWRKDDASCLRGAPSPAQLLIVLLPKNVAGFMVHSGAHQLHAQIFARSAPVQSGWG